MLKQEQAGYPEIVTVTRTGWWQDDHRQWVEWGASGIGMPRIEYTIQIGDRLTFYWPHPDYPFGSPLAVSINGGPRIPWWQPNAEETTQP